MVKLLQLLSSRTPGSFETNQWQARTLAFTPSQTCYSSRHSSMQIPRMQGKKKLPDHYSCSWTWSATTWSLDGAWNERSPSPASTCLPHEMPTLPRLLSSGERDIATVKSNHVRSNYGNGCSSKDNYFHAFMVILLEGEDYQIVVALDMYGWYVDVTGGTHSWTVLGAKRGKEQNKGYKKGDEREKRGNGKRRSGRTNLFPSGVPLLRLRRLLLLLDPLISLLVQDNLPAPALHAAKTPVPSSTIVAPKQKKTGRECLPLVLI